MSMTKEEYLEKVAGWKDWLPPLYPVIGTAVGSGLGYLGSQAISGFFQKGKEEEMQKKVLTSYNQVMQSPTFRQNPEQARERFSQISALAPTVAATPFVAEKILKRTLKSGLNESDMQKLVSIETNMGNIDARKRVVHPLGKVFSDLSGQLGAGLGNTAGRIQAEIEARDNPPPAGSPPQPHGPSGPSAPSGPSQVQVDTAMLYGLLKANAQPGENPLGVFSRLKGSGKLPPQFQQLSEQNVGDALSAALSSGTEKKGSAMTDAEIGQLLGTQYSIIKVAMEESLTKTAAPSYAGSLLKGLMAAGTIGLGFGAAHEVGSYARTKRINQKIKQSWEDTSKDLKTMSGEGSQVTGAVDYRDKGTQDQAKKMFGVLSDIAPDLASNSVVAKNFVNTIMQQHGQFTPDLLKMISETQKNINTIKEYKSPFASSPMSRGFESGFSLGGGTKMVEEAAKNLPAML